MLPHPSIIPRFISGQWMFVWGHNPFARSHIRLTTHSLQEISIWSIVSVLWHKGHWALSSNPGMLVQYSLIFCVLCIVLYRNCWIFVLMCRFRRPRHMFPLVFCIPLYLRIAFFVFRRLLCIVLQKQGFLHSRIPWQASFWVSVLSFAPCRSKHLGISQSSSSGVSLFAPCFARRSLSSFPRMLSWPFTNWKQVGAVLLFSKYAAFLNASAFLICIQPQSSQFRRCRVRPSMTYCESVKIFSGQLLGISVADG